MHDGSMELRGNSELFDLLIKNVNGFAIFTLDAEGRVGSWNDSAETLLGYRADEIMGRMVDVFFTAEDGSRTSRERNWRRRLKSGRPVMTAGLYGKTSRNFGVAA
jgi:PAS domain S-box-containing protein